MRDVTELISLDDIESRTPDLSPSDAELLHEALNATVRRIAPCLATPGADPGAVAEARNLLLLRVLPRLDVDSWVESVTTGKYSVKFRPSAAAVNLLNGAEESALRRLCGATATGGLPEGYFPDAAGYDRLFYQPRRR